MISAITADQPIAASNVIEYRTRPLPGERSMLQDSPPPPPAAPKSYNDTPFNSGDHKTPAQPEAPAKQSSTMFAAAVLSGALPPVPETMAQLLNRIGISPIPEESQARLKDLLV